VKRHRSLASLSRDHHHALVLAQSLKRDAPARLQASWPTDPCARIEQLRRRFADELEPHFAIEERELLPRCAAAGEPLASQALRIQEDHEAMRRLIVELEPGALAEQLDAFGRLLEDHVRYEERSWFPTLERELGDEDLAALLNVLEEQCRES
jgi:hemerythrin-like domain-containing protein